MTPSIRVQLPRGCELLTSPGVFRARRDKTLGWKHGCGCTLRGLRTLGEVRSTFEAHALVCDGRPSREPSGTEVPF